MRKVLGTDNPADLMTKYLTRAVIDTHLQFMGHVRADGRAQAGLKVQGKTASADNGGVVGGRTTTGIRTNARETSGVVSCFSKVRGSDIRGTSNRDASPPAHSKCHLRDPHATAGGRKATLGR